MILSYHEKKYRSDRSKYIRSESVSIEVSLVILPKYTSLIYSFTLFSDVSTFFGLMYTLDLP